VRRLAIIGSGNDSSVCTVTKRFPLRRLSHVRLLFHTSVPLYASSPRDIYNNPQSLKTEPRIKREIGYIFFAKYTCVEMAGRKIQTYQNKVKNSYNIYFVFDLDGECKFIKTKRYSD